jgi:hypothetical protein
VIRRRLLAVMLASGVAGVACFELSAPQTGLSAISPIQLAWPSVVVNDVLRDENGAEAPLRIDAYDDEGNVVTDVAVTFIALDTGVEVGVTGVVRGLNLRDTPARVVAQARRGEGILQTPEVSIDVVPRPDSVAPAQDTTFDIKVITRGDPTPISTAIDVKVFSRGTGGAAAVGVKSWIVRYEILSEPPSGSSAQPTAIFEGGGTARVYPDTTDTNGAASRTVVLQTVNLAPGTGRQNVLVRVTVANTRSGGAPTTFVVTLPFDRP